MKSKFKIGDFVMTRHKKGIEGIITAITERESDNYCYELSYINTDGEPTSNWMAECELKLTKKDNKKIGFK